jgi:hypothetical protein
MRKVVLAAITITLASALSGCGTASTAELAAVGTTYKLTAPGCHVDYGNSQGLFDATCKEMRSSYAWRQVEFPAGTCFKLTQVHITYPELVRTVHYGITIGGISSTVDQLSLPGTQWSSSFVAAKCSAQP